jgi:hypothetical protein
LATETFNRYEKKYRLDEATFVRIRAGLSDCMQPDPYSRRRESRRIINLYYDTADSAFIRASLAKPVYREKLRLRAYGTPDADSTVYAEIKKKVDGLVNKRRSAVKLSEAYAFLASGVLPERRPYMNEQVLEEIACILGRGVLRPALYLAYEREAYVDDERGDLRISFDTNILARRFDLRMESGVYGEALLGRGCRLMEIKTAKSIPLWLCRLLSENDVFPAGFSKYGFAYLRALERRTAGKLAAPAETEAVLTFARAGGTAVVTGTAAIARQGRERNV